MSARKAEVNAPSNPVAVAVQARQTRLALSQDSVVFHRNGLEFRSPAAFAPWAEMTLTLQSAGDGGRIHCTGVVISCSGNKHAGYHISMVLTGLSRQAQARLSSMAGLQHPQA